MHLIVFGHLCNIGWESLHDTPKTSSTDYTQYNTQYYSMSGSAGAGSSSRQQRFLYPCTSAAVRCPARCSAFSSQRRAAWGANDARVEQRSSKDNNLPNLNLNYPPHTIYIVYELYMYVLDWFERWQHVQAISSFCLRSIQTGMTSSAHGIEPPRKLGSKY